MSRDVLVIIPARLRVTVANAILAKAAAHRNQEEVHRDLLAIAAQVDDIVAVGRSDREAVYRRVAKATGVTREKVREIISAFRDGGERS